MSHSQSNTSIKKIIRSSIDFQLKAAECDPGGDYGLLTKLTQVQTEVGSLHQAGVLTHGPNIKVHEDGQACERGHPEPHQEEQVGQEHQLHAQTRRSLIKVGTFSNFNFVLLIPQLQLFWGVYDLQKQSGIVHRR